MCIQYSNVRVQFKRRAPWYLGLLGFAVLTSCGSAPVETNQAASDTGSLEASESTIAPVEAAAAEDAMTSRAQQRPQLIKQAFLQIESTDVTAATDAVSDILNQYQGDLLQLSDQRTQTGQPRRVLVELRVPQSNLEPVLAALRSLGTVKEQSITAEDVSTQLVDLRARIRNLRKSEEALLEIMERSGSIADVLEVTRELNTVRENIERMDAQVQSLQNRVAYSTISLTLISGTVPAPTTSPVGETLTQTWQTATASVRSLSVGLLQLLLWMLVFSPYLGVLVLSGWLGRRYWRRHHLS